MYLLEMGFDLVAFQWLWDLTDVSATHHHRNGVYTHSTVSLQFPTGRRQLTIKGQERTVALLRFMNEAQRVVRTAEARDDHTTLSTLDDLKGIKRGTKGTRRPWHSSPLALCVAACLVLMGTAFLLGCHQLNLYFDDLRSWKVAQGLNTATSMRAYVRGHPKGRFVAAANSQLGKLYDEAFSRYRLQLSKDHDPEAVEAVRNLLGAAQTSGNYGVNVTFEGTSAVPGDIHTALNRRHRIEGVLAVGDAFGDRKMEGRERRAFAALQAAFRAVIPGDVLDLRLTQGRGAAQGGPRSTGLRPDVEVHPGSTGAIGAITVSYRVIPSDSLYYRDSDEQTPAKSRPFYPGIVFDWDCHVSVGHLEHGRPSESASTLRVGDEATSPYAGLDLGQPPGSPGVSDEATDPYAGIDFGQPSGSLGGNARAPDTYVFQLQSKPADKFRETGAGVYEDMTESAFVDFRQELVRRLGIAVKLPSNPFDAIDWSAPAERGAAGGPLK
jgi:hypothetical protein